MRTGKNITGFVIALAWPSTYCKEPGAWYDPVTRWLGISRYNYYRAGHAALVLIERNGDTCHYFDFGRYHAPFRHGRVRSGVTDHELKMKSVPKVSPDGATILNFKDILTELQLNQGCHGEGNLYASYCQIDFQPAFQMALQLQHAGPLPYGPFVRKGSNCSRFVNTVIIAGRPNWKYRLRLRYFVPLTPTPMNNVNSLPHKTVLPVMRSTVPFKPFRRLNREELLSTQHQPERGPGIPENAQWLSGEGAGSWFFFDSEQGALNVTRYAPNGKEECNGLFEGPGIGHIAAGEQFTVDYPSDCHKVLLKNGTRKFRFTRKREI